MGGFIKQITVVAEDKVGLLADISYILGKARINIDSLAAEVQGNKCLIDISVKDEAKATSLLTSNGYQVLQANVLVVRIKDEPAQMAQFASRLAKEKINTMSMRIITKENGYDTYALQVDHTAKAKRVLAPYMKKSAQ
ncbi:MAG: ACT domain-containing protein [Candidatus Micrarchaeia archaeon]